MFRILNLRSNYQKIIKPMIYRYSSKPRNRLEGIKFEYPVPESRFEEVVNLFRNHFYVDEPLLAALKLCKRGEPQPEMDDYCMKNLKEGFSIAALDEKTDKVIATVMNGIIHDCDPDDFNEKLETMTGKIKEIFKLLYYSNQHLDLFCRYNVEEIFEIRLLSVDSKYFGRGLAKELIKRSVDLGQESGYRYVIAKADCTGFFSQKLLSGYGFQKIHEIRYSCYKDKYKNVIFRTAPPHDTLAVMVKQYPDNRCLI
ncbi:uncharacterized protein LOC111056180 [Nilaparvata lugens]|uniref:uncharacterized protein LOC111056180 n=1 Tax=Nilaparvata lugens TaxID=108931 RepID=UPI00193DA214|nr:uncharacterized protein LOC111056180 [Nilaparvata lugens]